MKSYNSTLSLFDYNLGDVYAFYVHNNVNSFFAVDEDVVRTYSSKIKEVINEGTYSKNDGKWSGFTRVVGVVVGKHKSNAINDADKITVMFKTDNGRYVLDKYVVNSNNIFTNNKDIIPPAAVLRMALAA